MPTYQYACNDCGEQLEVVQKFTDDALTVCPECEGNLRKVYSAVGIVFKGSGFYRTDNRTSSSSSSTSSSNGSSNGSSGGSSNGSSSDGGSKSSESKSSSGSSSSSSSTPAPAAASN
ncbi:putative regulatory protein, FmdB family [Nonomuraea wenchangensis]|uniref:Putative regulatory protein, FmdB family n=1 Tax=Nonomuraea wenchangensis TaxID=568860 RepID=A0A1I0KP91_9ACTN|nr:FmdB family zinc ribbon protein [Nonomuraea wenchangensis]SEU27398.1 putative regulatory protein, FmdB family [Nonomuraea wenchangensis]